MRNETQLMPILKALFVLNRTGANDKDMSLILDYAFRTFHCCNTNILSLVCAGKTKEDMLPIVEQLLEEETNYMKYKRGEI